jgi:LysR family transcriptional regulator, hydrogen peroxide-inducible genes activator
MNLRDLRYLVTLADYRHFGRAAEACFVSQPTLSTQLKKLEDELGLPLVERNPRNVLLTELGEKVAARARVILREAEDIKSIARRFKDPEAGRVRIGIFPTLGPYLLPHVVPEIVKRFPTLALELVEEKTEVILASSMPAYSRCRSTTSICTRNFFSRKPSSSPRRLRIAWRARSASASRT